MADFRAAKAKTDINEGGVSFNPEDPGNVIKKGVVVIPTYIGIAPAYHSAWQGFPIIIATLQNVNPMPRYGSTGHRTWCQELNKLLAGNQLLQKLVDDFYETNFWHANRLGEIMNQKVAEWIYDHAVNAGGRGIMWAQLAARATPDGAIGPKSIAAINAVEPGDFLERVADIAGAYRLDRAAKVPSQIQFLASWLTRDGQPREIIEMVRKAARDGKLDVEEVALLKDAMEATA